MAPAGSRKRAKPNPSPEDPAEGASQVPLPPTPKPSAEPKVQPESSDRRGSTASWYSRTWPRKAAPVAEVARESISAASNVAADFVSQASSRPTSGRSPSLSLTKSRNGRSSRSGPADATTTKINITSDVVSPMSKRSNPLESPQESGPTPADVKLDAQTEVSNPPAENGSVKTNNTETRNGKLPEHLNKKSELSQHTGTSWLGWFSKQDHDTEKASAEASKEPPATETPSEPPLADPSTKPSGSDKFEAEDSRPQKRSWLQMWGGSASENAAGDVKPSRESSKDQAAPADPPKAQDNPVASGSDQFSMNLEASPPPALRGAGSKSSGWVFWSRDKKERQSGASGEPHVGEIAISDTPSQNRPKRASISSTGPQEAIKETIKPVKGKGQGKGEQQVLMENRPETPGSKDMKDVKDDISKQEKPTTPAKEKPDGDASKQLQKSVPNQVLPSFKDTFLPEESPSLVQQLSRLLNYTNVPETKHVHKVKDPPRIKNALAIGVHGYFPAPLIRSVLGQPTGTSIKFADMAARAIRIWTEARSIECIVKTAALEGEGRIAERVDILWKLLLNWIEEIRKADFILVACHSQGVPVATMLVAKLISFGCVNSARIGVCAMAGVNMGPFQDFKSRWISGSAAELFDFSNPGSQVSLDYMAALETAVKFGVRILYTGSIDDQLVSMESSTFSPISHPYIFRAVFIDGRVHAPNFLSHLVGFALKLRNLGIPDHGLVRELSSPLAGSLYGGEGHSRVYEEEEVYSLAIEYALETTSVNETTIHNHRLTSVVPAQNPYILPFAMRGLLEEEYVKTKLHNEATELLRQFDEWKPSSKVLKDVKFRLEGIRAKL